MNNNWYIHIILSFTFAFLVYFHVIQIEGFTSISVGFGPSKITYNPFNHNMYVTNSFSDTISVIDSLRNQVIKTIHSSNDVSHGIVYNPFDQNMYVANKNGVISIISSLNNNIINSLDIGENLVDLTYNPFNGNLYISNDYQLPGKDGIIIVDGKSHSIVDIISILSPFETIYSHLNGYVYASSNIYYNRDNLAYSSIYSINPANKIDIIIPIKGNPTTTNSKIHHLIYNHYNERIYTTSINPNILTVIDVSSNRTVKEISFGGQINGLEVDPHNGNLLVSRDSNTISIVSPISNNVIKDIPGIENPSDIEYNPFNGNFYIINFRDSKVTVIPYTHFQLP